MAVIPHRSNRGASTLLLLAGTAFVALIAVGALLLQGTSAVGWDDSEIWHAKRGSIEVLIPASGELAALNQTEITNKLEARAVITEAIPEGTLVKKGDVLLRFKDDDIRERLKETEDGVIAAESMLEAAQADLEIRQRGRDSAVAKANVDVELATLALNAWLEGDSVSQREDLATAVETAVKNFERQERRFISSQRLAELGFISEDQMRGDEIAFIESKAHLRKARRELEVYDKYTYDKERTEKESTLEQAQDELVRVQKSQDAEVHKAENQVFSAQRQLDSVRQWNEKWQEQLANCTVIAPQDGMVVYASSLEEFSWMRYNNMSIQPGSEMYHNQLLMVLPDTSKMVASVKVNEAISGAIKPGQAASISCDAAPGRIMCGTVESISILAESGQNWHNRKEYTVRITIDDAGGLELKPAMRCKVDIEVDRINDALHVPLQAVHHEGDTHFVYVPAHRGCAEQAVEVGKSSDLYIEIASGLNEGDPVLLVEPAADEIVERIDKRPATTDGEALLAEGEAAATDDSSIASSDDEPNADVLATPEIEGPVVGDEPEEVTKPSVAPSGSSRRQE